jgi:multidrug transporter EmrE-like cation transporter
MIYVLLLAGIILNALASLFIKAGMNKIGEFSFGFHSLFNIAFKVAASPFFLLGLACYVVSLVIWVLVLSRLEVSIAYPMVSIGYVINAVLAYMWLGEDLSLVRIIGIIVICGGVVLVARN